MLRSKLLLAGILIAGAATAHETSDPAAVDYGDTVSAGCDNGAYAADATAVRCSATEAADVDDDDAADVAIAAEGDEYADDAPVYGGTAEYYPGVSLFVDDYWVPGFGFGWPYYAYAPFAYGWPYYGLGFASWGWGWPGYGFAWWGGHHHHDHHGWHDHHHRQYASRTYPGPYRYLGHGRYANRVRATSGERTAVRADRGTTRTAPPTMAQRASVRTSLSAPRRAALPSAAYYAMARRSEVAPRALSANQASASARRSVTASNHASSGRYNRADHAVAARTEAQRYAVTSLPSRRYAPSSYHRERAAYPASPSYVAHSRGATSYAPSRYAIPNRGYSGASRAPSYSRAPGFAARSAAGPPMLHGGGGSPAHASAGGTHAGNATPPRH